MPETPTKGGVTQITTGYADALARVGTSDSNGKTIVVAYIKTPLILQWWMPIALKALVFTAILIFAYYGSAPLKLLPDWLFPTTQLADIQSTEIISRWKIIVAAFGYLMFAAVSHIKSRRFVGQIGADIHFFRFGQKVDTLEPGHQRINLDPRVSPFAVATRKPFTIDMAPVTGTTADNISLTFRGSLIMRVRDTFRLIEQGGLETFLKQLHEAYQAALKDQIQGTTAPYFNRFMFATAAHVDGAQVLPDITKKLAQLDAAHLSVVLLHEVSAVGDLNVSNIRLTEADPGARLLVLSRLQAIADRYGIEVVDHLPLGNMVPDEYLGTIAIPMLSSLQRLQQATDVLMGTRRAEIDEDIQGAVAKLHMVLLEVGRITSGIASIQASFTDPKLVDELRVAKETAIRNIVASIAAPLKARIDGLIVKVQSLRVQTTGKDRYIAELTALVGWLEQNGPSLVPSMGHIVSSSLDANTLFPGVNFVDLVRSQSGIDDVLNLLKVKVTANAETGAVDPVAEIEREAAGIDIEAALAQITERLAAVTTTSGVNADQYKPDEVARSIDEIIQKAGIRPADSNAAELTHAGGAK